MTTKLNNPGLLAAWLALEHPQFFAYFYRVARQPVMSGFGRLGQDDITSSDTGTTTTFDTTDVSSTDAIPEITVSASAPVGVTDTLDVNSLASPNIDSSQLVSSSLPIVSNSGESTSWLSSLGTSLGNAVSSTASFLGSASGLTALTNLGTAYYKANTPQAAVISTQAARVASGSSPGAITYAKNAAGQLVPVGYNTAGSAFPLSSSSLSSLIPSGSSGMWLGIGLLVALAAAAAGSSKSRRR